MKRFSGKTAIVTGGSSGIGRAVVERLASEGASVVIWDLVPPQDSLAENENVSFAEVDLSNPKAVYNAREKCCEEFATINVLVCSAGITGPNSTVELYPENEWRRVFDVNTHGVFYCNKSVVPLMKRQGHGHIVNIASIAGKEGNPNASAYSSSKAAVIGFTKSLAKELAQDNVIVNAVTPAAVRTPIFDQMTEEHIEYMLSKIPMGRFGTVDEIAAQVAWLCSDECSFSTGAVFDVSGGRAVY